MIRKQAYKLLSVLALIFGGLSVSGQITAPVEQGPDGKKYYFHKVESGQTLWQIRGSYQVSVDKIKAANPSVTDWDKLSIGQLVMVPITKDNKKPDELPSIEGDYLNYKVKKGVTMSQVARDFNISMNDILAVNADIPDLETLKEGQVIRIPILKSTDVDTTAIAPADTFIDSLINHLVVSGDNLYQVAKRYSVDEVDIIELNPHLRYKPLKVGWTIRIPKLSEGWVAENVLNQVVAEPIDTLLIDSTVRLDMYNVAVLLPFYLAKNDAIQASTDPRKSKDLYRGSIAAFDFYHGIKLAVDSLTKQGLSVNLYVYDTARDTTVVKGILAKPELKNAQLIIGPMSSHNVNLVANFAKRNGIAMVSPITKGSRILLGNAHVSKVTPSNTTQVIKMAQYIVENHHQDNVLLVDSKKPRDTHLVNVFKKEYEKLAGQQDGAYRDSLTIRHAEANSIKALSAKFKSDMLNVIVLPSTDLAYVSHFFTKMAALKDKPFLNYRFMIVGMESWLDYEDITSSSKKRYDLHVTSSWSINYGDTLVLKPFVKKFRREYKGADPGKYSFMGFDVGYYYLSGLMYYGTAFTRSYGDVPRKRLYTDFDMMQTGPESGFENTNVYILQYSGFSLIQK